MRHADLIEKLGGGTKVADKLTLATGRRVDREAVYKWQKRDRIPAEYWAPIVAVATGANIKTSIEDLATEAAARTPPFAPGGAGQDDGDATETVKGAA